MFDEWDWGFTGGGGIQFWIFTELFEEVWFTFFDEGGKGKNGRFWIFIAFEALFVLATLFALF